MGTPVGSAILDNEIVKFFEELIEFYGHGSPQARIIERVKRRLELVPVGDKYERLVPHVQMSCVWQDQIASRCYRS